MPETLANSSIMAVRELDAAYLKIKESFVNDLPPACIVALERMEEHMQAGRVESSVFMLMLTGAVNALVSESVSVPASSKRVGSTRSQPFNVDKFKGVTQGRGCASSCYLLRRMVACMTRDANFNNSRCSCTMERGVGWSG
jgi:hypothetical protein